MRRAFSLGHCFAVLVLAVWASVSGVRPSPAQFTDTSPSGMVAFFMSSGAQCPSGWTAATQAQGRLILGVTNGSTVGVTVGSPLASQTAPSHQHSYQAMVDIPSRSIAAWHCCNNQGAQSGYRMVPDNPPGSTGSAASHLPLIQLVVCQKQ